MIEDYIYILLRFNLVYI